MYGAIAGDIIGSVYEFHPVKTTDFELFTPKSYFTDDTVMTIATAVKLLDNSDYVTEYKRWGKAYPYAGYGGMFARWLLSDSTSPYNSFGNGSAMRISPVGFASDTVDEVLAEAERSAEVTHNHPEGIKGAQATGLAILLARRKVSKTDIQADIESRFGYDLRRTPDDIRPTYEFNETCQATVPEALCCFLAGDDYESVVRLCVSLGGDADTLAAIAGPIAEAYYGIPDWIIQETQKRLQDEMKEVVERFYIKYQPGK
jgi:ADP-ribosylglycohydrolase